MSSWGWGNVWGGQAAKPKDVPKNAILGLRGTLDMLNKRERHLQTQMDEQEAIARKNVNSNKGVAKAALRRKKNFEQQLEQTSAQMMSVENQISSIETANINKETLDAMSKAKDAMQKIHGKMGIGDVDQTMEDLREQHAITQEIAEALTQGSLGQGVDEGELDDELESMQQEQMDANLLKTGSVPVSDTLSRLPNAAVGEPKHVQPEAEDEEEELKKLQAEMAF